MMEQGSRLAAERRDLILERLLASGAVRVAELTEALEVTPVTLRRDLQQLEAEGLLVRVHGGAVLPPDGAPALQARQAANGASQSSGAPQTIGVLVPSLDFYWPRVIRGMEQAARERGAKLLLRGTSYEMQDERPVLERMVEHEGVAGLVVAPNTDTDHAREVIEWLHDSGLPFVLAERDAVCGPERTPAESVTTDHALGAVLAARHLAQLGHRKVGLFISRNSPTSRKIIAGWSAACRELGLTPGEHVERILPDRRDPRFSGAVDAVLDAVLEAGVTALLVHSDREAMAIIDVALARGLSVPEDLSVVAYDDEVADLFTPALTAVTPPRSSLGRAAVETLLARIHDPSRPVHRTVLSPSFNSRLSTAPPRSV